MSSCLFCSCVRRGMVARRAIGISCGWESKLVSMLCRRHATPCTGRHTTWGAPRPRWSTTRGALRPRWNSVVATGEPFVPAEFWTSRAEALLLCFREPLVACMSCCRCCACRCSTCACLLLDAVLVDAVDACRVLDAVLVDVVLAHACL